MTRPNRITPLPRTADEVKASRATPNAPGVFLVRQDKRVTGLHVHPTGIAMLDTPDFGWRPEPAVTKVRRGLIKSRIHITFADGSKTVLRPYAEGKRGLAEAGEMDSMSGGYFGGGDIEALLYLLIFIFSIIMFIPWMYMLGREVFGASPRAKVAATITSQIRGVMNPGAKTVV